jgi:acyl-CoA thioesterase FadM
MLRTTHTSTVTEEQIDHLGHMNVRYYAANAHVGTRTLLGQLGWGDQPYRVHDAYTRHHREQLLGTPLVVRSAVLGADEQHLRLHHELAAADTGVLAATFVHRLSPIDDGGRPAALDPAVIAAANAEIVPTPDYAATRTISLDNDLMSSPATLDVVRERGLAMRTPRAIPAEECDADGRYRVELAALLTWGGEFIDADDVSEIFYDTPDGIRMGWASMETRVQLGRLPKVGDRIQAFGAAAGVHDKVTHRVHWVFDVDDGALISSFEVVSMAFDLHGRRSMSIPEPLRQRQLDALHDDLMPRTAVGS